MRDVIIAIGHSLVIVGCGIGICLRLANSDLTETELFTRLWNAWIVVAALICVGAWAAKRKDC